MKPSIIRLRALEKQLYAYLYAMTVIDFDAETVAPEGSADGRAEATEVLSRASFDLLVNDGTAALLKEAAADAETEQERAEVRNLQRQYDDCPDPRRRVRRLHQAVQPERARLDQGQAHERFQPVRAVSGKDHRRPPRPGPVFCAGPRPL